MGCGSQNSSAPVQTLQGAGASFPAPIYQHWFSDLATNKNIQVNYQSVGSGAGVRQLIANTVDFAASSNSARASWLASSLAKSKTTNSWADGNEGTAATVSQLKGALGYVEASYVRGNLQAAAIALASIALSSKLTGSEPNPAVGYPIVTFTWGLFYQRGNGAKQQALQKAFAYILSDAAQAQALTTIQP